MQLHGIHHLTAVTADARGNHDFYTRVLGMRLVKKTVNQDDTSAYHLFYADGLASPGTGLSESGTLHRVEESFLRQEVEAAGFKLAAEGTFLRNPNDPRDKNTPDPPMPKDEFFLKFVKP